MTTFGDIIFDEDYSHATFQFLLLNHDYSNSGGVSPVIVIPHIPLMTFIRVFHDLIQCQQYIRGNDRKLVTMVISNRQLVEWNNQTAVHDGNLDKICIFSESYGDYLRMKQWKGCHANKIRDVYQSDTVGYKLLLLGIDHVFEVKQEFREDQNLHPKFCRDGQRLSAALADHFQNRMNN